MGKIPFGPISHVKTLKVLDLSKNRVEKVEDPFFTIEQLKLDRLYLMDNNIETLPTNSFANFEFINYTTLSGNPLRIIEEEAFKAKIQIIKFSEHERVAIQFDNISSFQKIFKLQIFQSNFLTSRNVLEQR